MGVILSQLKPLTLQRPTCPLLNTSLPKIREFHASFKSICDNFSIDLTEFEQIFSTNETSFAIWDTDDNGYIDALELFSGLVAFSESRFEDKIKFLFDLFDFNELGQLSTVELQFLLHCCLNSTFKIFGIKQEIDSEIISNFVDSYFAEDTVINLNRLIKWCNNSEEINEFFSTIKKDVPAMKSHNASINFQAYAKFGEKGKKREPTLSKRSLETKSINDIYNSQKYKNKLEYLANIMTKAQSSKEELLPHVRIKDSVAKMSWVYGFRCNDVRHPLQYIGTEIGKATSEKLLYISGCVVIVYFKKSNEQIHYLEHEKEVISLTVSQSGLVASGELGDKPAIHIWDCTTLQNIAILKGIHTSGISLLCFLKNNECIASCGARANSPLLIYSIRDGALLLSTYLQGFALDIRLMKPYFWSDTEFDMKHDESKSDTFVSCTDNVLYLFTYETGVFTTGEVKLQDFKISSPITACMAISLNIPDEDLHAVNKKLLVVTGHKNGKVLIWENMQGHKELTDCKGEVLDIACFDSVVVIAYAPSFIQIWDLNMKNMLNSKPIDLREFVKFKLFSFRIGSVTPANKKFYIVTVEGDVVEISLKGKKDAKLLPKAARVDNICKIRGPMRAIGLVETANDTFVYVAGQSETVAAFSSENHHLVYLSSIEDSITAIDAVDQEDGKKKLAVGTLSGKLQIREEIIGGNFGSKPVLNVEKFQCTSAPLDLKFSGDGRYLFVVCEDGLMYLFTSNQGVYFSPPAETVKRFALDNDFPISINFSDDHKTVLIGTSQRMHHTLDLNHPSNKLVKIDHIGDRSDFSILNLRYPSHTKNYLNTMQPTSFWNTIKAILAADDSGTIFHWKDITALTNNCGGYLKGHSSQICRFALTKNSNTFFSLGATDRTLIQWQIENITDAGDKKGFAETKDALRIYDEPLNREIAYATFSDPISDRLRDSFVLFRGTSDKTINAMLYDNMAPFEDIPINKRIPPLSLELNTVFGFQSSERRNTLAYVHYHRSKPRRQGKQAEKDAKTREENPKPSKEEEEEKGVFMDKDGEILHLPPHLQKQMLFSSKTPIPYDTKHEYCERYFTYFVSRIAIIYNPLTNEQRFYEGHRYRITSLCVHPSKMIVATGESSISPCIHVWSILNLEPFKVLQTHHKNGILNLKFSNDGVFLISIGVDSFYSIQIFNWKTEETIVFRNTGPSPILDVIFNPYNKYEFTTVGYQNIAVWQLQGRSLTRKNWIHLKPPGPEEANASRENVSPVLTAAAYLNYHLGKGVDSDIIVSNNFGEIGLITFGKYVCLRKEAHAGMINCLKVTDMIAKKLLVLTTGEDECLRIWDTAFNLIHGVSLRRIGLLDVPQTKNISIQSIDVYCCQSPSKNDYYRQKDLKEESTSKPVILLGTRNGDILEAVVNQTFTGLKSGAEKKPPVSSRQGFTMNSLQDDDDDEDEDEDEEDHSGTSSDEESGLAPKKEGAEGTISLSFSTYLRNHSGKVTDSPLKYQQQVLFALHPYSQIMYTAGEDQHIYLWDIEKFKLLMISNQGLTPTAIKLSPNGDILAVGFINGTLALLDAKMDMNVAGKHGSPYVLPSLEWAQPAIKEKFKTPIVNIEFSPKGNIMAISYSIYSRYNSGFNVCKGNHASQGQNLPEEEAEAVGEEPKGKEGAYIAIYATNAPGKTARNKNEKYQYVKMTEIRPVTFYQQEGDQNLEGKAVYFMNFSADENFLLLYYQDVDNFIRVNEDTQSTYIVWNIDSDTQVTNIDVIKNIRWKKFNFPNSLYGQYQFYNNLLGNEDIKKDSLNIIKRPIISSMYDYSPFIIGGSINGDIHFFKSIGLHLEKNYPPETLKPERMCMSKTYAGHVSFVNQVELKGNYIFSSGVHDGCIMQWRLIREEEHWDADYLDLNPEDPELNILSELPPRDKFENLLNEILPLRHQVYEIRQNADDAPTSSLDLELEAIIGRKAFDRRNNLFYNFDEKIIYSAGPLIVMYDPNSQDDEEGKIDSSISLDEKKKPKQGVERHQEFLRVDEETLFPTAPEVSSFAMSLDKRFICVGTQELNARLLIWEVCSRTCIKTLKLSNCCSIQNIKFAFNARHVCAVGVTPEYTQIVYLIDALKPQILGCVNLINSFTSKVRDIMFFPNSIHKFVTCGVQHMSVWKYSGSNLSFFACSIEKPRDMLFIKPVFDESLSPDQGLTPQQKEDLERLIQENQQPILRVIFTCVCFVQNAPVTGDTNGFIYIWQNFKISKRQTAHFKSAVLCLNALKNTSIFVSGGEDGRVIVWQLSHNSDNNSYVTEKFYEYSITSEDITRAHLNPRNHVQSIFVGSRNILAGTKTGDIYELLKPKDSDLKLKNVSYDSLVVTRLSCNDHEIPKAIGFSHRMDKIYAITQKGLFCVWDIKSLDLLYSHFYSRNTLSLIAFKNKPLVLIAFDNEVIMLNAEKGGDYKPIQSYQLKYTTQITDVKVSFNEKSLAVALSSDSDRNAKIQLFNLENKEGAFKLFDGIENLVSSVNFLDFSTDNSYLLYKDNFGVPTVYNIISRSQASLYLEFDVEWVSDGIQESDRTKGVQSYYNVNNGVANRILKMVRLDEGTLAVTDEMGTMRLFRYPCETGSTFGYYQCYSEHMNYLNNCVLSNDRNYLLTSSENDKSIFLWRIKKTTANK